MKLIEGEYYFINGTKTMLYWSGTEWMKPQRDRTKRYGLVGSLVIQPVVKSVEWIPYKEVERM